MEKIESDIAEYVGNHTRWYGYPPTVEQLIRNSLFFGVGDLNLLPIRAKN